MKNGVQRFDKFLSAMIIGPLSGLCIKKFDKIVEGHMPAGFEMLINNFSVGIIGMLLAMISYLVIGSFMNLILAILTAGVNILVEHSMLPLIAVFIEPAKVLFLNNAINHGIFTPIATAISFGIASVIIRTSKGKSLEEVQDEVASRKAEAKGLQTESIAISKVQSVKKIVFACDAGMGSSAMGVTIRAAKS